MSYGELFDAIITAGKKCIMAQVIFILFKVLSKSSVSWFWVFFPMWGPALVLTVAFFLIMLYAFITKPPKKQ